MDARPGHKGACHCGAVRFEVTLKNGFATAGRCSCSFCRMRGAVTVSANPDAFHLVAGADKLTLYQFNTRTAKHYFCSVCGIYTHHRRRTDPNELGVNAACLEGVSPFDFADVPVIDGINHPSDNQGRARFAGTLRFDKA